MASAASSWRGWRLVALAACAVAVAIAIVAAVAGGREDAGPEPVA